MDYNIERKICLKEKNKDESLYGWCLNEIDEKGKSQGDEVTWPWSFSFTASSLRLQRGVEVKCDEFDAEGKKVKTSDSTSITADLYSGSCSDGENLEGRVNFKMFGTNRSIKKFDLCIFPVDSIDEEDCSIFGSPSYDYEVDFKHDTTDDVVVINLYINREKFDEFAKAIELKSIDFIGVRMGGVSGFYSHWSPSISTSYIKVLTPYHQVEDAEGSRVQIFRTGHVGEFRISLHTINELNIKPNLESIDFYKKFRELGLDKNSELLEIPNVHHKEDEQSSLQKRNLINSIKIPLWLIFIVLCLILITK